MIAGFVSRLNSQANCQGTGRLVCLYRACVVQTGNRVAVTIINNQRTSGTYVRRLVVTGICKNKLRSGWMNIILRLLRISPRIVRLFFCLFLCKASRDLMFNDHAHSYIIDAIILLYFFIILCTKWTQCIERPSEVLHLPDKYNGFILKLVWIVYIRHVKLADRFGGLCGLIQFSKYTRCAATNVPVLISFKFQMHVK